MVAIWEKGHNCLFQASNQSSLSHFQTFLNPQFQGYLRLLVVFNWRLGQFSPFPIAGLGFGLLVLQSPSVNAHLSAFLTCQILCCYIISFFPWIYVFKIFYLSTYLTTYLCTYLSIYSGFTLFLVGAKLDSCVQSVASLFLNPAYNFLFLWYNFKALGERVYVSQI